MKSLLPDIGDKLIADHLSFLGDNYFVDFTPAQIAGHLEGLRKVSPVNPVEVRVDVPPDGHAGVTVMAYDYPFVFSLITGVLGSMGMNILSGRAYTYGRIQKGEKNAWHRGKRSLPQAAQGVRRMIIDQFHGPVETHLPFHQWSAELGERLRRVFSNLEKGDPDSVQLAKHTVNEMVVERIAEAHYDLEKVLYPVDIRIENADEKKTVMKVTSIDTPFFLYTLSNALSLHHVLIEQVAISTIERQIVDEFHLSDPSGRAVSDGEVMARIKLSVLLTKQFSYFLVKAPDPYVALSRFELLVKDVLELPQQGRWIDMLSDHRLMQNLARILGASDFLWEDFIRLQYESLIPMLENRIGDTRFPQHMESFRERLTAALGSVDDQEGKCRLFNEIKDREIFLIDLDHILGGGGDFAALSRNLTLLAETVVDVAAQVSFEFLSGRYGRPRTVAGIESRFAVMGLGKFGGAALGYASDIELLFVYDDSGRTDGGESIDNSHFFNLLVREVLNFIHAKREGIFRVDLRLRPFGGDGPLACSLDSYCRYYGPGGSALAYERLSLVRMRTAGGDRDLGERLERLRDEFIYTTSAVDIGQIRDLREKQFREKNISGRLNAKFSPGALVDLEYTVQILQVLYGKDNVSLRTPKIHEALRVLADIGVLEKNERQNLLSAYNFLRNLINGLRMLRGSAQDLYLPPADSLEFVHLARRMNYKRDGEMSPGRLLYLEFETMTAMVRTFVERHLGRESLPGPDTGNVADLVLSINLPERLTGKILRRYDFRDTERAADNLKKLAGRGEQRDLFAKLAILACDILSRKPDPDMALNNWERYIIGRADPAPHYAAMLTQPRRLDILLSILSASQFLADTLIRNPGFFEWVSAPENLYLSPVKERLLEELSGASDADKWMNELRRLRRREILRIGTRDIYLEHPLTGTVNDLSVLAEALVESALERAWESVGEDMNPRAEIDVLKDFFCVMAFGKLGGKELNYSSDIDLMGIYEPAGIEERTGRNTDTCERIFIMVLERMSKNLSRHTEEGYAYRVDFRLRPYGASGTLVPPLPALQRYYGSNAKIWEIQALLKMRPVAGNLSIGFDFLDVTRPLLLARLDRNEVVESIRSMRQKAAVSKASIIKSTFDVKNGVGGIRDIEFMVQGLQLLHAHEYPQLLSGNTLGALTILGELGLLPADVTAEIADDYLFLRRVEHFLQLYEDRQVHTLPSDPEQMESLSRRILGVRSGTGEFMEAFRLCTERVRQAYNNYLLEG